MRSVNIAELKNRLSTYIRFARNGEEVVIRDRNLPVAKIVPFDAGDASELELRLVAEGKMKLPEKPHDKETARRDSEAADSNSTRQASQRSSDRGAGRRVVVTPSAFWDSSALAPLCMREPSTQRARTLFRQYSPVVWWAADVELYSAIARSLRFGSIDASEAQSATAALDRIRLNWREIVPGDDVRSMARNLLDIYPLKAADSLQLAAALTWCDNRPAGRTFLCGDKRLAESAKAAGFSIVVL